MRPYPQSGYRRPYKPKLPPSGPLAPPRREICLPIVRHSVPRQETVEEMLALAPEYLQPWLRKAVARELDAESSGVLQPQRRLAQTSFLEQTGRERNED